MSNTRLARAIGEAANEFAVKVVEALKGATLEEIIEFQSLDELVRFQKDDEVEPGEASSPPAPPLQKGKKRGPKPKLKPKVMPVKSRGHLQCAHPDCTRNRYPRGQGYCGEHWRELKEGEG